MSTFSAPNRTRERPAIQGHHRERDIELVFDLFVYHLQGLEV